MHQLTGASATVSLSLDAGWNMISIPLYLGDYRKSVLFPAASSAAFAYSPQGYQSVDTLMPGTGYWLKFGDAQTAGVFGLHIDRDTIDVVPGWNLIGSVSNAVAAGQIASIPGGMITSQLFGYTSAGYFATDSLRAGKGYWVKVNQSGKLLLSPSGTEGLSHSIRIVPTSELPPDLPDAQNPMVSGGELIPKTFSLLQNYPNPFNPVTMLRYGLPGPSYVSLTIYSILGQKVATVIDGWQEAGYKSVQWNAERIPSGVYFCRMIAGSFSAMRKMIILK